MFEYPHVCQYIFDCRINSVSHFRVNRLSPPIVSELFKNPFPINRNIETVDIKCPLNHPNAWQTEKRAASIPAQISARTKTSEKEKNTEIGQFKSISAPDTFSHII